MHKAASKLWAGIAVGAASLLAGCAEPAYVMPGPVSLQPYPPPVAYDSMPYGRPPISGPIPLQAAPLVQPLPPPTPAPTVTEVAPAEDTSGAIPVQDLPPPVADTTTPSPVDASAGSTPPATTQVVRKAPTTGPGSNVPLEGFRPMHGQSRPTP